MVVRSGLVDQLFQRHELDALIARNRAASQRGMRPTEVQIAEHYEEEGRCFTPVRLAMAELSTAYDDREDVNFFVPTFTTNEAYVFLGYRSVNNYKISVRCKALPVDGPMRPLFIVQTGNGAWSNGMLLHYNEGELRDLIADIVAIISEYEAHGLLPTPRLIDALPKTQAGIRHG